MRYILILNEDAGKAGQSAPGTSPDELRAAFADAGIEAEVRVAGPGRIEETLRDAAAARPDAVIVGGGDGTVRSAAAALAGMGMPLGVLPLGTFNHFAKDLKMPVDVKLAVAALATGQVQAVDVGEVNGHVFINNCSIGAYAEAVRRRDALRDRRGMGKWWAMCRASYEEFRRLRRLRLRISTELGAGSEEPDDGNHKEHQPSLVGGVSHPDSDSTSRRKAAPPFRTTLNNQQPTTNLSTGKLVRTPVVVVGNNRYSGHLFSRNLRPRLDEGRLWLYTVHARRHLAVLRMMWQSLFGQLDEADALAAEPATGIVIASECGPLPVAADGEVLPIEAPLHFRIRPGALRVIAPLPEEGGDQKSGGERQDLVGAVLAPPSAREVGASADPTSKSDPQVSGFKFPRWPEAQR